MQQQPQKVVTLESFMDSDEEEHERERRRDSMMESKRKVKGA
jgi:hypothetical protein